jgi:ADP-ribose pyrophosphatase YjhB (NUDIX family)/predicted kinase
MLPKPCLIFVNGHPASGKTTLARKLGEDLGFPVFHRDEFKENLWDNLGWEDPVLKQKIAQTSYKVLYQITEQFLKSNQSFILESNFSHQFDSPFFQKLLKKSPFRLIQIHCSASPNILFQRFKKRASNDRHSGHGDNLRLDEFKLKFQQPHLPLQINTCTTMEVDTSDFKKLNYPKILQQVKFLTYFAHVERAYYEAGAFGMIFNQKGELLLCHRQDRDVWNLPGGIIDQNESPWEAVVREVKEEVGLKVKVEKLTGLYFKPKSSEISRETLVFNFLCKKISGKPKTSNEVQDFKFFPLNKLPKKLNPNQRERILDFQKNPNDLTFKKQKP